MDSYLSEVFSELYNDDGLVCMAKGIGLNQLFSKFMQLYTQRSSSDLDISGDGVVDILDRREKKLVFVLNAGKSSSMLQESLLHHGFRLDELPLIVNNETSAAARHLLYAGGGCFLITSRVLIIDLLRENIHPSSICGFLIYNAHQVTDLTLEAFILNLYRQNNRDGFIKAFTDQPESLINEFHKVERILKTLFVKRLYLYPRFHSSVANVLEGVNEVSAVNNSIPSCTSTLAATIEQKPAAASRPSMQPEVVEISQPLTPDMKAIQSSILVAMEGCLRELKKGIPSLDVSVLNLQTGIFKNFDYLLRSQLDSDWHRLSSRLKQVIEDVKTLRNLLDNLLRYDSVTFYSRLLALQSASVHQYNPSMWLTTECAEVLFSKSKSRVYDTESVKCEESEKSSLPSVLLEQALEMRTKLVSRAEMPPKWTLLGHILQEIQETINQSSCSSNLTESIYDIGRDRVLIIVKDENTLLQIQDLLNHGGKYLIDLKYRQFISSQCAIIRSKIVSSRRKSAGKFIVVSSF